MAQHAGRSESPHTSRALSRFCLLVLELQPSKQQPSPSCVPSLGCHSLLQLGFFSPVFDTILAHAALRPLSTRLCARTIPLARHARSFASTRSCPPLLTPSPANSTTPTALARAKLAFHTCTIAKMDSDSVFSDGGESDGYMPEPVSSTLSHPLRWAFLACGKASTSTAAPHMHPDIYPHFMDLSLHWDPILGGRDGFL